MSEDWITQTGAMETLPEEDKSFLQDHCRPLTLPQGKTVFAPDSPATHFILVIAGSVKVTQAGKHGREIVLYRVGDGETCILTTSCLLSGERYNAEAVTETEVKALLLPAAPFNLLLARSEAFRQFVFSNYATRIASLLHLVEEVTFEKLDTRLAHKLLALASGEETVEVTHQNLATELGTAREVVSRHLKEFDRKGWISITRGHVRIVDIQSLKQLAQSTV